MVNKIPSPILDIHITLAGWRKIPRLKPRLEQAATATLDHLPKKLRFPATATLLLTGNAKVRQLNRDFRGMDKATDVLSFPQYEPAELPKIGRQKGPIALGDIALAYQYVVVEAKKENKILINYVTHLVIHGLLHLFGYDHMEAADAAEMEKLEIRIMKSLNLPNPYADTGNR